MSEIIIAVVFFFLGFIFRSLIVIRQQKKDKQMKLEYGISNEINYAKDLREKKTDDTPLSMIEKKIYDYLLLTMAIIKKSDKHVSLLDFDKTIPEIIVAWQQAKEYFETYGMDAIRKGAKSSKMWAEFFELFQEKLKEVPLTFKEKYIGPNALPAPELEIKKWLDSPVFLAQLRGKVVLLNFWGLRCVPCKQLMPRMQELLEQYGDKGLEVISIHLECKDKPIVDFFSQNDYTFKKAIGYMKTWKTYPIRGVPTNFLINKSGHLVEGPIHDLPEVSIIEELLAG